MSWWLRGHPSRLLIHFLLDIGDSLLELIRKVLQIQKVGRNATATLQKHVLLAQLWAACVTKEALVGVAPYRRAKNTQV